MNTSAYLFNSSSTPGNDVNMFLALMMDMGRASTSWRESSGGLTVNNLSNPGRTTIVPVGGTVYCRLKDYGSWSGSRSIVLAKEDQTITF